MLGLIDSHCHLTYEGLFDRIDEVLANAAQAGVSEMITIAEHPEDARRSIALSQNYPNIYVVAGVHPHNAAKVAPDWDAELLEIARRDDVYAVGEMGLDYHYDFSDRESQRRMFRRQLEIAMEVAKPVVIHCREAHEDVMRLLGESPALPGVVFHCFSGTLQEAREILDAGYWPSFTGVVSFKRSDELRAVVRETPDDRLMLETDAPYLSPEPVRKIRPNEPALMVHTAACVARERNMEMGELAALTARNTRRFFRLPEKHD